MAETEMKSFDFATTARSDRYFFMTSTIIPRPIAIVSTLGPDGHDNLAPFSYFNAVSSDPPCLMFSIVKKRDGIKKDTLINIEHSKEFVVHIAMASQLSIVEQIGEDLPYGESERNRLGLTLTPSRWIKTPHVAEFPVAYECVLENKIEIGANTMVIGRIMGAHIQGDLLIPGQMSASPFSLDPLSRLGLDYAKISPVK